MNPKNLPAAWQTALFLLVAVLLWLPRGLALDRFVTPDEPKWLTRSGNFYESLAHADFAGTYQKEHPGVTVMWAGALGYLLEYPGFASQSGEQIERTQQLKRFLDYYNKEPMAILAAGRAFVALAIVAALALSFLYALRLFGVFPALAGFALLAFDPFSVALSRLLHLDGLASALMLLSLLAFLGYQQRGRSRLDLALSGAAAGLSWLTKSPALFLALFVGLLLLIELVQVARRAGRLRLADVWAAARPGLAWAGVGAVVFVLLWPAMWVDPIGSLRQVFGQATNYAIEGHETAVFFNGSVYERGISAWYFYPLAYLWRATPAVLAGLIFALLALVFPGWGRPRAEGRRAARALALFSLLFAVFMTLGAKKFDRYLLPSFAPLDLLAGAGWIWAVDASARFLASRPARAIRWPSWTPVAVVVALLGWQAATALPTHPYYFSYYNPLLGGIQAASRSMMIGWGEGLDQAARYLNAQPNPGKQKVVAWYADGCFSYIFSGSAEEMDLETSLQSLKKTDYVVIYYHQWQRRLPSPEFLAFFDRLKPVFTAHINGFDYARVYLLDDAARP